MKTKNILIAGGIVLALVLGFFFFGKKEKESSVAGVSSDTPVILYTTKTCSHCKVVKDWLAENDPIKAKSALIEKDANSFGVTDEMLGKMKECGLDTSQGIRVPFLYDNGECFLGDSPVIDHLSQKY